MSVKFKISFAYLLIVLFVPVCLNAQDLNTDLKTEIATVRNNKYAVLNKRKLLKFDNSVLLDSAERFSKDTSINVRYNLLLLQYEIALKNKNDSLIRHKVVNRLINAINDTSKLIQQQTIKFLMDFSSADFNKTAKDTLLGIIKERGDQLTPGLILLIGKAGLKQMQKYLIKQVNYNPISSIREFNSGNWAMHLVLARFGNTESMKYCLNSIETYPDTITRVSLLLYEVAFTQSIQGVLLLKKYLNSNGRLPALKKGPGDAFNQYACDVLAGMLEGFPIKQKGVGYTDEEIETARAWMNSRKNFVFKN